MNFIQLVRCYFIAQNGRFEISYLLYSNIMLGAPVLQLEHPIVRDHQDICARVNVKCARALTWQHFP